MFTRLPVSGMAQSPSLYAWFNARKVCASNTPVHMLRTVRTAYTTYEGETGTTEERHPPR